MQRPSNELEDIDENDFLDSIDAEDFVFVINHEGNLKTLVLPDEFDNKDIPKNITAILNVFGVDSLNPATLH